MDQQVKITKVIIKNLFGNINQELMIDDENPISILIAPNGCGKTTTFRLLTFILRPSEEAFSDICEVPFDEVSCTLDNGLTLTISKPDLGQSINDSKRSRIVKRVTQFGLKGKVDFLYTIKKDGEIFDTVSLAEQRPQGSLSSRVYYPTNEEYYNPIRNTFGRDDWHLWLTPFIEKVNELICTFDSIPDVEFIQANRIQKPQTRISVREMRRRFEDAGLEADHTRGDCLCEADKEIKEMIQAALEDYNHRMADAQNVLPKKYIAANDVADCEFSDFKKRWENYHNELNKFNEVGFLPSAEANINPTDLESAFQKKGAFLLTYLDVVESTLEPLQKDYEKIKLFIDIFNQRNEITHKHLRLTSKGIEIYSNDQLIDKEWLSSGEKNDFVMFYRLIFKSEKNGIVLIDEPEISLHIEWQEEYLDRLLDVCKMNGLQAIVATHSPNIINGHIDYIIEKR